MRQDNKVFRLAERLNQIDKIEHEIRRHIRAIGRPLAFAMAAQIQRDHMIISGERIRDPIPRAPVIAIAMQQQEKRRALIAPIPILEREALRH